MNNHTQVNKLGTSKIGKLMVEFSIPAIIGLVVNGLYNTIDSIFIGHGVGEDGLTAVTVAMPVMILAMSLAILIGAGGNALAALRLGEGKSHDAEKVLGNCFTLTIIIAVAATVAINLFMDPVLMLSGATEEAWDYSHVFMRIISLGFILQFLGMGFNNFIRTAGDPNRALYTMVAGTLVCIVLNYLFVMVLGWGMAGSAWATVIGQGFSAALVLWYFIFTKRAPFKLKARYFRLIPRLVGSITALGAATFVLQMAMAVLSFILNNQLKLYGALDPIGSAGAIAAIGVVQRVAMFAFFPILGVAMAAQPILGYNYGAKNYRRVKSTLSISFVWVIVIGILFWLLVHLLPWPIVHLFGVTGELESFTVVALQVQMFFMPLVGLQVVVANYFQSSGQPFRSMFVSLTRQVLYLVPLMYLLPYIAAEFPAVFGVTPLQAIYYTYPTADLLSVVTAGGMILLEFRKLNRKIRQREGDEARAAEAT
ncbi:MAG: MATE family efflux transporter [Coriobacteriales bacterium]|jgi:putative MATE family efflux protein|nr:MATE family efflux transporter [Coriobacteriales bacterium]